MCFETCHKVFYLFGCGCEWRLSIHTKEQALMFLDLFFFFSSSLSTNNKRSRQKGNTLCIKLCKGAFGILFTHAGQSDEMESVTSPTALPYFSTLWYFYAQLNHQMCLFFFFFKQWHSLRKSIRVPTLSFYQKRAVSFSDHILSSTISSGVSWNCCILDDERFTGRRPNLPSEQAGLLKQALFSTL